MIHAETYVQQFPDGATYHIQLRLEHAIENNSPKWLFSYAVNGHWYHYEKYSHRKLYYRHDCISSFDGALLSLRSAALRKIQHFRIAIDQPLYKRMQRIIDTLRYDATLQKQALGVFPDSLNERITIKCLDSDVAYIADAIHGLTDGIAIVWKLQETIAETQQKAS